MAGQFPDPLMLVDGALRPASDSASFPIINPGTGDVIGHAPDATAPTPTPPSRQPGARSTARAGRPTRCSAAHCLRQLKAALDDDFETLREITIAEAGVPRMWTDGPQLRIPVDGLDYLADCWRSTSGSMTSAVAAPDGHAAPCGGCAGSLPGWSRRSRRGTSRTRSTWPSSARRSRPGCTVVLKPAPDTPWTGAELGRLIATQTDIPAGVVNVLTASGSAVAAP